MKNYTKNVGKDIDKYDLIIYIIHRNNGEIKMFSLIGKLFNAIGQFINDCILVVIIVLFLILCVLAAHRHNNNPYAYHDREVQQQQIEADREAAHRALLQTIHDQYRN